MIVPHLPVVRWTTFAVVSALLLALPSAPAFSADATAGTIAEVQVALADCATQPHTITVGANISAPDTGLTVACNTTLKLGTFNLNVLNILIAPGVNFTVTGPTVGKIGTLTVDPGNGSTYHGVGIRTTDAIFTVTGGIVNAYAGDLGAAIGGHTGRDAGTLNVTGGTVNAVADLIESTFAVPVGGGYLGGDGGVVTVSGGALNAFTNAPNGTAIGGGIAALGQGSVGADITVTGGILTATSTGGHSTAIGGGSAMNDDGLPGGAGGSLLIGPAGEVVINSSLNAFGGGFDSDTQDRGDFGSLTVDGILRLQSSVLIVDDNPGTSTEVTVGAAGKILGGTGAFAEGAGIVGAGQISNQGVIALDTPAAMVSGNNKLVTFDTGAPSVRVFAPSFATGVRALPAPSAHTAWNTAADGSGTWFTPDSSTAGSGTLSLYAVAPATVAVSTVPANLVATAGTPFPFPVIVNGPSGTALSPQPPITYASTNCTIVGGNRFNVARLCAITASTTVQGVLLQAAFDITVVAGALNSLTIAPPTSTVVQGASVTFTVDGTDAEGNSVDISDVTLGSSVVTDKVVGRVVTFFGAGSRVVAASLAGKKATATIGVNAGPLESMILSPSASSVVQSGTVAFTVTGTDAGGNPVNVDAAILSSSAVADTVAGRDVQFSGAGSRVVTATLGGKTATASVEVVAGPLATLAITPASRTVVQGATTTFTVTGHDAAGNPVDVGAAVLESSMTTDVITAHSVTFSGAGSRVVTTTLDGISASSSVEVEAGPLATLAISPSSMTLTEGDSVTFAVTGADAGGNPINVDSAVVISDRTADVVDGRLITFAGAGSHVVTASLGRVSAEATIAVVAGPLALLTVTPSAATVEQGDSLSFTISGSDAAGNPVDVSAARLISSFSSDTVNGRVVTFSGAGTHVVTATLGDRSATASVEVVAGALATLQISPTSKTVRQGDSLDFSVTGADSAGNVVNVDAALLASDHNTDVVASREVTFSGPGSHTVTAALNGVSAGAVITVVSGLVSSLSITPSAAKVDQGDSLSFTIEGSDSAGNAVDASDAVLTSSVATDVITGLKVTFPHASPHTITATLGGVSAVVTINVTPAQVPLLTPAAGLPMTGIDSRALTLTGTGALALILAGGVLLITRRRTQRR